MRSTKAAVFLSYRREDSGGHAGRLYDALVERLGEGNVFRDRESIPAGADFARRIEGMLMHCTALIAVIGRDWLTRDPTGERRPSSWVCIEIAKALEREIEVIPVLVYGASRISAKDLPTELQALLRLNDVRLNEDTWSVQVEKLLDGLDWSKPSRQVASMPVEDGGGDVALAPGGARLLSRGAARTICVWTLPKADLEMTLPTGARKLVPARFRADVSSLAFAPHGRHLAAGRDGRRLAFGTNRAA